MNIKDISQEIWKIEKKFYLFQRRIDGIYFWKLARFNLYKKIKSKKNLTGQAHTKADKDLLSRLLYLPRLLKNTFLHGAITRNTQRDILIFPHARPEKLNDKYIDKFTKFFIEDLENKKYEIVDIPYRERYHYKKPDNKRSYNEHFSFIDFLKRNCIKTKLEDKDIEFLKKIQKEIEEVLDVEIELVEWVKRSITRFKCEYNYYEKLIKKRNPKEMYFLVSYGKEPMIAAAKDNGVKTIEFQHGMMNRYHLGYSFPNTDDVPYFPDKILLFGKYWHDATPLPEGQVEIEYYGFPYMDEMIEGFRDIEKKENQLIFISQGPIGAKLSKVAYEMAKQNKDIKIVYKLHPGEYDRWQKEYPWLVKAVQLQNFRIIDNNDIHLYELLARSEYQVGVSSTAIFEGIVLDCKTIIMDLPGGKEYMEYLIFDGYAKLAGDTGDIMKYIEEDDFPRDVDKTYFFEGVGDEK